MKQSILILMSMMFSVSLYANDLAPVAIQSVTPSQTWFYNLEEVVFDADDSYVPNGYIYYTKWYVNGVLQTQGSYYTDMSICFALPGSPAGDCYQLASGQTTVQVKLEVQSSPGGYWDEETITYTIQEHKGRKYFVKDHLGSVRATVNRDGNVLGYDDYYPFGLTMPGRSSNSANPNDKYKFTGHERDDEAGLTIYHMNARGMDPVLGRMMQIDSRAEKYPGISSYAYVLNSPVNFTDMTGDTVDVDDELKEEVVDEEGNPVTDKSKMTPEEEQRYEFQQMWKEYGPILLELFGPGGEYESTTIKFKLSTKPKTWPMAKKNISAGLTTFAIHGTKPKWYNDGGKDIPVSTHVGDLSSIIYLNPNARGKRDNTAEHELKHFVYIFETVLNGEPTIKNADFQHKYVINDAASILYKLQNWVNQK